MFRSVLIAASLACLSAGAALADTAPTAESVAADPANWRKVDPENLILFQTTAGDVVIEIFPEAAPAHAVQFRAIIESGDFDGTAFHRVIDDFMAQGGDIFALKGRESGLPNIPGEFTFRRDPAEMPLDPIGEADTARAGYIKGFPVMTQAAWLADMSKDGLVQSYIPHCPGIVSTARTDDPDSANSQFFLMRGRSEHLDKQYTAWGRIIDGADVVYHIKTGAPVTNPDILTRAVMASSLPAGETLEAWVQRTDGPEFRETLAAETPTGDEDVCELPAVPAVVVR